jgi:hypothetical protein
VPVQHILHFGPNLEVHLSFVPHAEVPAQAYILGRLPLPAVVIVVCRRGRELSAWSILPSFRIQYQFLSRVETVAIRILEERIARGLFLARSSNTYCLR